MGVTHSFAKYTTKIWRRYRGREDRGKKRSARTLKCLKAHENILTATTSTKESIDAHRVVSRRVYSKEK